MRFESEEGGNPLHKIEEEKHLHESSNEESDSSFSEDSNFKSEEGDDDSIERNEDDAAGGSRVEIIHCDELDTSESVRMPAFSSTNSNFTKLHSSTAK